MAHLVPRDPAPPSQGLAGGALDASPVPRHSAQAHRMTAGALKPTGLPVIRRRQLVARTDGHRRPHLVGRCSTGTTQTDAARTSTPADAARTSTPADAARASTPADAAPASTPADAARTSTPADAARASTPADAARTSTPADAARASTSADAARSAPPRPMQHAPLHQPMRHAARAPAMPSPRATLGYRWPSTSPTGPQRSAVILWLLGHSPCDCENPIHEQGAGSLRVSDVTGLFRFCAPPGQGAGSLRVSDVTSLSCSRAPDVTSLFCLHATPY
jgi:hypothetical protein